MVREQRKREKGKKGGEDWGRAPAGLVWMSQSRLNYTWQGAVTVSRGTLRSGSHGGGSGRVNSGYLLQRLSQSAGAAAIWNSTNGERERGPYTCNTGE
jgi:hypothetical protein